MKLNEINLIFEEIKILKGLKVANEVTLKEVLEDDEYKQILQRVGSSDDSSKETEELFKEVSEIGAGIFELGLSSFNVVTVSFYCGNFFVSFGGHVERDKELNKAIKKMINTLKGGHFNGKN